MPARVAHTALPRFATDKLRTMGDGRAFFLYLVNKYAGHDNKRTALVHRRALHTLWIDPKSSPVPTTEWLVRPPVQR